MLIVTVNTGSSSIKIAAYRWAQETLTQTHSLQLQNNEGFCRDKIHGFLSSLETENITAVSHRVVHGGDKFDSPCIIDHQVESDINALSQLAPLHNPVALQWIRFFKQHLPDHIPHIAVFDTGFFHDLPSIAREYALPRKLCIEHGLRKFGFHGIAHKAMLHRYQQLVPELFETAKIISLQLGSGCSITASTGGRPIDTSMGFTPTEGLIMATRSGDVDPGLICYLQQSLNYSTEQIEKLINYESGLLGISTFSADMRELMASDLPTAKLAINMYCYRIIKFIGSYIAALGGLDAIIISGGIGENSPEIRSRIIDGFKWLNVSLNSQINNSTIAKEARICSASSSCQIWVIPGNESKLLAEQAVEFLSN